MLDSAGQTQGLGSGWAGHCREGDLAKILVVESDPILGAVLEDRLRAAGHDAQHLVDRERALARAMADQPDLLILEVVEPGEAGLEVVRALRQWGETRDLPILVLSSSTESADRVEALRAGVDDHLSKPCDLEELALRAERLVARRAALAPVLQGDLANYPLWELVQYLSNARKSGQLELRAPAGSGRIEVVTGRVGSAAWEELSGPEALLAILGLKRGTFRFVAEERSAEATADAEALDLNRALMQAAWLDDELDKRRGFLPPTGAPLKLTGARLPQGEHSLDLSGLPLDDVSALVREMPGTRVFDLLKRLPRAPQTVRLAAAYLVECGVLAAAGSPEVGMFPTTAEIASAELLDMAVLEFLTSARKAGFGTTSLPLLVVVEPGIWELPQRLLQAFPGYRCNDVLSGLVKHMELLQGGSATLFSELGKLSLHLLMLTGEARARAEAIATVSAGVLLWLDKAEDEAAIGGLIGRVEAVKAEAAGVVVASGAALAKVTRLVKRTRRWRVSSHAPQTLLGLFGLLQPGAGA